MNVHRHFKTIDDTLFLINISYEHDEPTVVLKDFTMHSIVDNIVGPNIVKNELKDFDSLALTNIFDILIGDGVIQSHK
jgi:hypothetical protein